MEICPKLREFLESSGVRYEVIPHSPAYTAPEMAASVHVAGRNVVKCVMVTAGGRHCLVAARANDRVSLERLREVLGAADVRFEREDEFGRLFDDCDVGAMHPFGNLYGVPVLADDDLYEDGEIVFNGGNHTAAVKMSFKDFERLAKPTKADVAGRAMAR